MTGASLSSKSLFQVYPSRTSHQGCSFCEFPNWTERQSKFQFSSILEIQNVLTLYEQGLSAGCLCDDEYCQLCKCKYTWNTAHFHWQTNCQYKHLGCSAGRKMSIGNNGWFFSVIYEDCSLIIDYCDKATFTLGYSCISRIHMFVGILKTNHTETRKDNSITSATGFC